MAKSQNKKTTLFRFKGIEWIFVNLPYICFMGLLVLIYIANSHAAEHNLRQIEQLKEEVKDAKWKYMTIQKEIMVGSTQSQVEKQVQNKGLKIGKKLPEKLDANNT